MQTRSTDIHRQQLRGLTLLVFCLLPLLGCGSADELRDEEYAKLDPALQQLVRTGEASAPFAYDVMETENAPSRYAVLLRTNDPAVLERHDLPTGSTFDGWVTAHLTIQEIRRAATLDAVTAIQNSPPEDEPEHFP